MSKILIAGAGGAPSEGVIHSLLQAKRNEEIIGMGSEPADLVLSSAAKKFLVPYADSPDYQDRLLQLLSRERPDLLHCQNDLEVFRVSLMREQILATGTQLFMPSHDVIHRCVHKFKSYRAFKAAGLPVPHTMVIADNNDLAAAFSELGGESGKIWLRSAGIGGGGKGALATASIAMATAWIDHLGGWGEFLAAELLTPQSVTWLSIWHGGELVVAQSRERRGWVHGNRAPSGVTGVTKIGVTCDDNAVTETAIAAVKAVADRPHGIFGVDLTYDGAGVANPTEINISRFFTTVYFFTAAGLNMPEIFKDIALYGEFPRLPRRINPLPTGLYWVRGMDVPPRLIDQAGIDREITTF